MKKVLLVLLVSVLSVPLYAQTPWRALTFTNTYGVGQNSRYFNTTSANLYYGLRKNYSIQGWSGYQTHKNPDFQWFSAQTSVVKNWGGLGAGLGVQYGTSGFNANNAYVITTISYQFKLK